MKEIARDVHAKADHAREDGFFLKSLQLIDEATILYSAEKDQVGFAEIQGSRFLTLRHLAEQTGDISYMILAKHAAMSAAELADHSGNDFSIALPYFNLAKAEESLSDFPRAIEHYKKAINAQENTPHKNHARPAVLNDMKLHLAVCEYENGRKESLSDAEEAIKLLEEDRNEGDYTRDVWASGGHLKIAALLRSENREKATHYLQKAKEIIDANPDLKLRKLQWEKLAASFA